MIGVHVSFGAAGDAGRTSDGRPVLLGRGPLDLAGVPVILDHDWGREVGTVAAAVEFRTRGRAEVGASLLLHPDLLPAGFLDRLRLGNVAASLGAACRGASPVVIDRHTAIGEVTLLTAGPAGLPGAVAWLTGDSPRQRAGTDFARLIATGARITL